MCFLCLINHLDPLRIFLLMVYMFWSIFGINIFPFGIMSWFWTARIASVSSPFLWENFFLIFWLPLLTSSGIWLYKYPETWIYFSELIYVVLAVPYVTDFNIRTQAFSWKQDTPVMTGLVFMGLIFIMCREYLTLILIPFYSLCFLDQTVYLIQDCYDISSNVRVFFFSLLNSSKTFSFNPRGW